MALPMKRKSAWLPLRFPLGGTLVSVIATAWEKKKAGTAQLFLTEAMEVIRTISPKEEVISHLLSLSERLSKLNEEGKEGGL